MVHLKMVYLLNMVIFHGHVTNNQMVYHLNHRYSHHKSLFFMTYSEKPTQLWGMRTGHNFPHFPMDFSGWNPIGMPNCRPKLREATAVRARVSWPAEALIIWLKHWKGVRAPLSNWLIMYVHNIIIYSMYIYVEHYIYIYIYCYI